MLVNQFFFTGSAQYSSQLFESSSFFSGIVRSNASYFAFGTYNPINVFAFIFGSNAVQTSTQLIINKSDLIGLTPNINNTAESLFVSIILRLLTGNNNVNFIKLNCVYWGGGYINNKRVDTIILNFYKLLTVINEYEIQNISSSINPNDY